MHYSTIVRAIRGFAADGCCSAEDIRLEDSVVVSGASSSDSVSASVNIDSLNLQTLEREAIKRAISLSNGNLTQAAELLGITRFALYRKIDKLGV